MLKKILIGLGIVLLIVQFVRPEKNTSNEMTADISTRYVLTQDVKDIMEVACNDCHTNNTRYPWYASIQPVGWWMNAHVEDGKRHLNYSEFAKLPIALQYHKFEETVEVLEENEMPLASYTYLGMHPEAKLTEEQKQVLVNWAKAQMDSLKAVYPADSLVRRRR